MLHLSLDQTRHLTAGLWVLAPVPMLCHNAGWLQATHHSVAFFFQIGITLYLICARVPATSVCITPC